MKKGTISVLMTSYNHGQYIAEALEAILTQSFQPKEVIVVDDASTDNSVEIIKSFMAKHSHLRLLRNEKNMGSLYSVNRALKVASGDYIYSAASDDKVLPTFFDKSMSLLKEHPQAGYCCSDSLILENGKTIENRKYLSEEPYYFCPHEVVKIISDKGALPIISQTAIVKRIAINALGGYDVNLKWSCDLFAHTVIGFRYGFCYFPDIVAMVRRHPQQFSGVKLKDWGAERRIIKKMMEIIKAPTYQDVFSAFRKTAPFSMYHWEVLKVIVNNKEWQFFSIKLLLLALYDRLIMRGVRNILPFSAVVVLKNIARGIKNLEIILRRKFNESFRK